MSAIVKSAMNMRYRVRDSRGYKVRSLPWSGGQAQPSAASKNGAMKKRSAKRTRRQRQELGRQQRQKAKFKYNPADWVPYRKRNAMLRDMGFNDYPTYLGSTLWDAIRYIILTKTPRCVGCGNEATIVHHTSYDRDVLLGQDMDKLVSLCWSCHKRIEFHKGRKLPLEQANRRLDMLQERT